VAGWRDPAELEPPLHPDGRRDFRRLNGLLNQPHAALGPQGIDRPVWHCVVRAAPRDRMLSDEEWGRLARDIMDRTGLAPHGQDDDAVRWMAVRHADDHIHVVAMLARQDGTRPRFWNDFYRVREACQAAEERHGLRRTAPGDRTAGRRPSRSHGCTVTFWRYLPQHGPAPGPADLGHLLRRLHSLSPPSFPLPTYQPLVSVRQAIKASQAVNDDERAWLSGHCERLLDAYRELVFDLPTGMIHGDAWWGNLLRDGDQVVLADWDAVSTGPREIDLIPTLQAPRFGLPEHERDAFIAAYGHDIRGWSGYPVLRDIRELSHHQRAAPRRPPRPRHT
jgi:hypothetical protein